MTPPTMQCNRPSIWMQVLSQLLPLLLLQAPTQLLARWRWLLGGLLL
jgi:hypothetical protein